MEVITYLTFTLLSIGIQFCVMDFIQEKMQLDNTNADMNITSQKKQFGDILKELSIKPHALYTKPVDKQNNGSNMEVYQNTSIKQSNLETLSVMSSTTVEILYDEDMSTTENMFTTEPLFTTTEYENFTEMIFFHKNNETFVNKTKVSTTVIRNKCSCDLLYQLCDINCCCDSDCSNADLKLFVQCSKDVIYKELSECPNKHDEERVNPLKDLLCFVKTNIPDKRYINDEKYNAAMVSAASNTSYKWRTGDNSEESKYEFKKKPYAYGDPVWLLKHGSVYFLDMPSPTVNSYCSGRTMIKFLKEECTQCTVSLKDLEMINIMKIVEKTAIISVTEYSLNNSALNCSAFHCANWTVIACKDATCMAYNSSYHEPACTENYCTNIALKIDYIFHYYDSKITSVIVKLFMQKVSILTPFMTQEINVKFYLSNTSDDKIIMLSGNPGYIFGLPVIASYVASNYTESYFNKALHNNNYLLYPDNENGFCTLSNIKNKFVLFGINKRVKCKYIHQINITNITEICNIMQRGILDLLGLNNKTFISPLGNPQNILDSQWIPINIDKLHSTTTYERSHDKISKLYCSNLITRISIVLVYANMIHENIMGQNTILHINVDATRRNITYNIEDLSTAVTIDVTFVDVTKSQLYEFAGAPHLNIYLPRDFFFPLFSKTCLNFQCNFYLILNLCITVIIISK